MNLFAGAWEARDVTPLPVDIPLATDNQVSHSQVLLWKISAPFIRLSFTFTHQIQSCIELVSRAKKPVVLLGSQATLPPTPVDDIRYVTHGEVRTWRVQTLKRFCHIDSSYFCIFQEGTGGPGNPLFPWGHGPWTAG